MPVTRRPDGSIVSTAPRRRADKRDAQVAELGPTATRGALTTLPTPNEVANGIARAARMAGFDNALDAIFASPEAKEAPPNLYAVGTTGRPAYPRQSIANWSEEGQRKNELVYACLDKLATTASEPVLRAYQQSRIGGAPKRLPDDHPANMPIVFPRPRVSESGHLAQLSTIAHIAGNAIAYKERIGGPGSDTIPNGLHWIRLDKIRLIVDGNGEITAIQLDPGYGFAAREIPRDDLLHHRMQFDPLNPAWGISPVGVLARAVTVDNSATDFTASFFANAAVPYGMISTEQILMRDEADEIAQRWAERYGGEAGWNQPAVLGRGATYQRLGLNMAEMSFLDLRAHSESRICMEFGVPPIMVGAKVGLDRSTFSNMKEARESLWEDKAKPFWQDVADTYTTDLAAEFGDFIIYQVDFSNVAALSSSIADRWARAQAGVDSGWLMVDEARELVNLAALPGNVGKVLKRKMTDDFLTVDDLKQEQTEEPVEPPTPIAPPVQLPIPPAEEAASRWAERVDTKRRVDNGLSGWKIGIDRLRKTIVPRMRDRLERYVDELGDRVISRAQQGAFVRPKAARPKPFAGRGAELLRKTDARELERILQIYFDQIGGETVSVANLVYDLGVMYGDSPARMKSLARAARDSQRIVKTLVDDLDRRMAVADRRSWSISQLVEGDEVEGGLRSVFGKGDPNAPGFAGAAERAERIATASFTTASNVSAAAAFGEQGVKEVLVHDGSGLGDACDEINGSVWTVGFAADHELEHPNCTRILEPIIPEPSPEPAPAAVG